jgi:hypothetical protein
MPRPGEDERDTESKRIIERISRESDGGMLSRATSGLRDHVTAKDGEAEDAIDRLGTRVGRSLALILSVALIIWLIVFLIRGG